MQDKQQYKDRYPGLVPFDKGQSTIFFGRDQEKKDLFYQICLEKVVVLFGKSGLGKSSLLEAGVSPMLEANGYLPVKVRFTPGTQAGAEAGSENLLLRDFKLLLREYRYKKNIIYNRENPQLWEYIKSVRFDDFVDRQANPVLWDYIRSKKSGEQQSKKAAEQDSIVTPVFIFDQFEQFFQHPVKHQHEFLNQLAEVTHDETPYRILEWITGIDPEERTEAQMKWHLQPAIKIVFSLRSDKLASMQVVASFMTTVLRNRYELKPLTPTQAEQAIEQPAVKPDLGADYTPPFTFEPATLKKIVAELSEETNEIESSQLQIVCNVIEDRVKKSFDKDPGSAVIVNSEIINPEQDFEEIFDRFYETQLRKIESETDRELARKLIEDDLVVEGQRESISEKKLKKVNGIGDNLITAIVNTRLVREEVTSRGSTYELSHDTLIAPVMRARARRQKILDEKKREEDRLLFEAAAKKKDEELKEGYKQLLKEVQLREEAEEQRREVERLAAKVKSRGRWVIFLTLALFVASLVLAGYFLRLKENAIAKRESVEDSLKTTSAVLDTTIALIDYVNDSLTRIDERQIRLLNIADSISRKYETDTNPELLKIADSLNLKRKSTGGYIRSSGFLNNRNTKPSATYNGKPVSTNEIKPSGTHDGKPVTVDAGQIKPSGTYEDKKPAAATAEVKLPDAGTESKTVKVLDMKQLGERQINLPDSTKSRLIKIYSEGKKLLNEKN